MYFKAMTGAVLAASLAIVPADTARADAGDFIAGAIIGGIVGANAKKQRTTTKRTYKKRSTIPSTQEGRNIQASLNYFGFNAGAVDGQLGRRSRDAISRYQGYLGYPMTGQLSAFEQNLLIDSYNRAQAGGYAVQHQVAGLPDGTRGLLKVYRDQMAGGVTAAGVPQQQFVTRTVAPQATVPMQATAPIVVPGVTAIAPGSTVVAEAPQSDLMRMTEIAAEQPPATALPNFMSSGAVVQASLAANCNTVSLITNTNGGFTTISSMSDPNIAINEQFCLARTYAIARSEELVRQVQGFTPDQIAKQCEGFAPAMERFVSSLAIKPRDAVVADVSSFILQSRMNPVELGGTARICLGVGYRTDNMDVALGSALLLYALGEGIYGELMGHHLSQGFGTAKRVDIAAAWYQAGFAAAESGQAAVFVPGQPERTDLIRAAAMEISGIRDQSGLPKTQPASAAANGLPSFSISSD